MVVFNYSSRELTTKVVYYGPGLCGKTTNLQFIYDSMPPGVKGKMLSLATKSDRTLFFDFLPIDLGEIGGMKTKVQLYTVPGQVFYNETRRLVLKGADGVVFVADSQEDMMDANKDSFRNLEENLQGHGLELASMPHVLQFNKRDLPNALGVDALNEALNEYNVPFYEAVATQGIGVQETLRHITKLVLVHLNERYGDRRRKSHGQGPEAAAPAGEAAPQATPVDPGGPAAAAEEPASPTDQPAAGGADDGFGFAFGDDPGPRMPGEDPPLAMPGEEPSSAEPSAATPPSGEPSADEPPIGMPAGPEPAPSAATEEPPLGMPADLADAPGEHRESDQPGEPAEEAPLAMPASPEPAPAQSGEAAPLEGTGEEPPLGMPEAFDPAAGDQEAAADPETPQAMADDEAVEPFGVPDALSAAEPVPESHDEEPPLGPGSPELEPGIAERGGFGDPGAAAASHRSFAPLDEPPASQHPEPARPAASVDDDPLGSASSDPHRDPHGPAPAPPAGGPFDGDDILGVGESLAEASVAVAADEDPEEADVFRVAPPVDDRAGIGSTQQIDRNELDQALGGAAQETPGVTTGAQATEVDAADPLFSEPGVEPTRLAPGAPQEILVPLEVETGGQIHRYRLVLRLSLDR